MIKRLAVITVLAYIFFILEFIFNGVLGPWAKPEFLLLLVVFWGLYSGIRYSIAAAVLSGLFKDISGTLPFGTHICAFLAAAYLTTFVRRNLYQPGSLVSRAVVVFFVLIGFFLVEAALYMMHQNIPWSDLLLYVFLPALVTTMVVMTFVFARLRDLAVWLKL